MKFNYVVLAVFFSAILLNSACKKNEGPSPRTEEQEMEELDRLLTQKEEAGYDIDTTEMGVFYIVKEGKDVEGPFPQRGDTCVIVYTGFLPDGRQFDTSRNYHEDGVWEFLYRTPDIVLGLENGIGRMKKESEIELYIPSRLGHGAEGTEIVPPYTTLIYFIEMIDLRPAND